MTDRGDERPVALVLTGPTAVGKTDLAVTLAERFPCDIISVDSAMVYRGMDIGTAKPDAGTLARVPHALIDIRDPDVPYSAGDFQRDAMAEMERAWARGRLPLLVGGTFLYLRALHGGLAALPVADPAIRAALTAAANERGWPALHTELAAVDPDSAARIAPADAQRIQRALEVYRITGEPLSRLQKSAAVEASPWRSMAFALVPADRAELHRRIAMRFDAMLAAGLVDEVAALAERYALDSDAPSMRAVGYRQLLEHIRGDRSLADAVAGAKAATRQLAKRQLTWLRHDSLYTQLEPSATPVGEIIARAVDASWPRLR